MIDVNLLWPAAIPTSYFQKPKNNYNIVEPFNIKLIHIYTII